MKTTMFLVLNRERPFALKPQGFWLLVVLAQRSQLAAAILTIASMPAVAQWLSVPAKGIPRTNGGKPDLSALAPRKPDGKPDLSGIWNGDTPKLQNLKYLSNLAADFKPGEFPIQPWAEALTEERTPGGSEWPPAGCLPPGVPVLNTGNRSLKIIQEPSLVVILYEVFGQFRQIFLDGRTLPKDPNPTWLGYSVGRWDGDILVVDTAGFNGKTWLDVRGHPTTEVLHVTERFRRRDFGHLDIQLTIDDPKAYTKPWTVNLLPMEFDGDNELLEDVCNENEKDLKHMGGK
jgi:hypothetical protein